MVDWIKEHLHRYPGMEITDVLKLIYQSEFGGGHFVQDTEMSLARIREEYEQMRSKQQNGLRLWEPIGMDMCRIYLGVLEQGVEPETLNKIFVLSANCKRGSVEGLENKLREFLKMCESGEADYAVETVKLQVEQWRAAGYPAISHSATYREHYHPAYRVAKKHFGVFLEAFLQIDRYRRSSDKEAMTIVIDGMCGSGKTTLGELLQQVYGGNLYHMDDFFLQPHQRTEERLAEIGGNVDYERFRAEIWEHLKDEQGLRYGVFDCGRQCINQIVKVPYRPINIIEGSYSAHPYFGERADIQLFLEISGEEQIRRIRERNGEGMLKRFREEWIPKEEAYFEAFGIREKRVCLKTEVSTG